MSLLSKGESGACVLRIQPSLGFDMNDMDGFPASFEGAQICTPPCPASSMEAPFKLDEGYSEETRSQYDDDSSMGIEPRGGGPLGVPLASLTVSPDVVMSMSEAERSGIHYLAICLQGTDAVRILTSIVRICIQRLTNAEDIINRRYCRTTETTPSYRPPHSLTS